MALKTRKPTGRAGWPKILVEGGDKAGKSWSLAKLSASPKVGRTAVLVLGEDETRWEEYGKIPGARFEIIEHNGTWASILGAVEEAKAEAAAARDAGEKPFVLGIDTMTAVWEGLKDWASLRARNSKKNRALLAQDPDAEIDVTSNYWNDAKARHRILMRHLLTFPGIVVLIARGSEVTLFQNGQPVAGRKTWSIDGEKNLPFDVSTHIRLSREDRPLLVSSSGLHCQIRPGIDRPKPLPDDWSLESVIFDMLKLDAATAEVREFTTFRQQRTPEEIRDEALTTTTGFDRIRELHAEARELQYHGVTLENESGDEELLLTLLVRVGKERMPKPAGQRPHLAPASAPAEPAQSAEQAGNWYDDAIAKAAGFKTEAEGQALWRESAAAARDGRCTPGEATHVQNLINARIDDRRKEACERHLALLSETDEWRAKVEELSDDESARAALEELTGLVTAEQVDMTRAQRITRAIVARFPKAGVRELEPAAKAGDAAA